MKDTTPLLPGISIVIPVYNSEDTLQELILHIESTLHPSGSSATEYYRFEAILVNDGSKDQSWETIGHLSRVYPWVRGINLMRNYGQHNALLCGVRDSRFDTVVT